MPLLLDRDSRGLNISSILCYLQKFLFHVFKGLSLIDGRKRSRRRVWVVDEENRGLFCRLRWEENRDVVNIVEALDPDKV